MLAAHHHPVLTREPSLAREGGTPGTAVYGTCSACSFREPWEGRCSGEGGGDHSGSHFWLPSLPGAPALGQEQHCGSNTCQPLPKPPSMFLWAQQHHPAHVWLIQTSGHTQAPRSCSDCSAEIGGPHQKANSQRTTSTPLPPKHCVN